MSGRIFTKVPKPASTTPARRPNDPVPKRSPWVREPFKPRYTQPAYNPNVQRAGGGGGAAFDFTKIPIFPPGGRADIRAKLTIGKPNGKYEQEADRVADQVTRMPDSAVATTTPQSGSSEIQRTCATCAKEYAVAAQEDRQVEQENLCPKCKVQAKPPTWQITPLLQRETANTIKEEDEQTLQTSPIPDQNPAVTHGVTAGINAMRGGGQPLSPTVCSFMEPRFGHDFSQVRIHSDSNAATISKQINARAFTVGQTIAFGAGQYQPDTLSGKKLLAHELTHVVQQNSSSIRLKTNSAGTYRNLMSHATHARQEIVISKMIQRQAEEPAHGSSREPTEIPSNLKAEIKAVMASKGGQLTEADLQRLGRIAVNALGPKGVAIIARKSGVPGAKRREREIESTTEGIIQRQAAEAAAATAGTMWWLAAIDGPLPIGDIIYGALILGAAVGGAYLATRPKPRDVAQERTKPRVIPREKTRNCATVYPHAIHCSSLPGQFSFPSPQAALQALKTSTGISNLRLVSARRSTGAPAQASGRTMV